MDDKEEQTRASQAGGKETSLKLSFSYHGTYHSTSYSGHRGTELVHARQDGFGAGGGRGMVIRQHGR